VNGLGLSDRPATIRLPQRTQLDEKLERFFHEERITARPIVEHR
jgi:hypothetical protein